MDKYVIVAFRVDKSKSVHYRQIGNLVDCLRQIRVAFEEKGAQFISVRRIDGSNTATSNTT